MVLVVALGRSRWVFPGGRYPVGHLVDHLGRPTLPRCLVVVITAGQGEVVEVCSACSHPVGRMVYLGLRCRSGAIGEGAPAVPGEQRQTLARAGQASPSAVREDSARIVEHGRDDLLPGCQAECFGDGEGATVMSGGCTDPLLEVGQGHRDDHGGVKARVIRDLTGVQEQLAGLFERVVPALTDCAGVRTHRIGRPRLGERCEHRFPDCLTGGRECCEELASADGP
jgi:hypothetical protein